MGSLALVLSEADSSGEAQESGVVRRLASAGFDVVAPTPQQQDVQYDRHAKAAELIAAAAATPTSRTAALAPPATKKPPPLATAMPAAPGISGVPFASESLKRVQAATAQSQRLQSNSRALAAPDVSSHSTPVVAVRDVPLHSSNVN